MSRLQGRHEQQHGGVRALAVCALLALALTLSSAAFGATTTRVISRSCPYWATCYVPIAVTPGDGVTSMDFTIGYNASIARPQALYRTPLTTAYALTYDLSTPGVVTAHLSGAAPLAMGGDVVWIAFDPVDPVGGSGTSTALTWIASSLNGGALTGPTVNGTLAYVTPQTLISAPVDIQAGPGANVPVLISATAFTGGDAFDIDLEFDPSVVTATSVEKMPLTQPLTLTSNISVPGFVRIALFGVTSVQGPGDLVKVWLHVNGPIGSKTPFDITRGNINEGGIPTTLRPGLFTVCQTADADGDTFTGCAGDCNDANPSVHPGATELCNGVDDDCDGTLDDAAAPPAVPGMTLAPQVSGTLVSWTPLPSATGYDVVRGSLSVLAASGGSFTLATGACLADDAASVSLSDGALPATGDGFWYLVRGSSCGGAGTYDSGAPSQSGLRDAEIASSASACP